MSCCNTTDMSNMVPIEYLMRHIMPYVPKVPHSMGMDMLRQSYIELARKSSIIVQEIEIDIQAGVKDYSIIPEEGFEIYLVKDVRHPTHDAYDYWGDMFCSQRQFRVVDNCAIVLRDCPSQDEKGGLRVLTTLLPSSCTSAIPESIATPYGKGIAMGALADLMLIPNKPWSAIGLAARFEAIYNRTVLSARQLAGSNRKSGPLKAKPVRIL